MAKPAKTAANKTAANKTAANKTATRRPDVGGNEMLTLLDFVRFAVSRFVEAKLTFAHGTADPVAEAAFLVCEALHLHPAQFDSFSAARVTTTEAAKILDLIERRVTTGKPAAYLVNKIYMGGLPFYVDERVIVPRSFIGELLDSHFGGADSDTRMVSPIPSASSAPNATADLIVPWKAGPASVTPRCNG